MIKAFSQKLMPPFSGQVQIAESDVYRALTLDGLVWEVQYVKRSHIRVCTLTTDEIKARGGSDASSASDVVDPKLGEMLDYLVDIELPFEAADNFEYWLLDTKDKTPIALLYSCSEVEQMTKFPTRSEWTALPDAVMPIIKNEEELSSGLPPVNYRVERLVAEHAGTRSEARWFDRREHDNDLFPPFLLRHEWPEADSKALCQRYIDRQAPRLLMLHGLERVHRERLESCCEPHAMEVARFCNLYPETVNEELIRALRVEARLREVSGAEKPSAVQNRRDGVLYM